VAAPPKLTDAQRQAYLTLIDKVVKSPTWKIEREKNGWVDSYLPGDAFGTYVTDETKRVTALLTTLGLIK
jgi:putative tricarboxylic transport membrane protein